MLAKSAPTFAKPRPDRHAFTPISLTISRARTAVPCCARSCGSSYWNELFMSENRPPIASPPTPAIAPFAAQLSAAAWKKSVYFFCCVSVSRSASVQPGGSGSCPSAYTGAVIGSCPEFIVAEDERVLAGA
jgi:hypothetical protein